MRIVLILTLASLLPSQLEAQVVRAVGTATPQPAPRYSQSQSGFGATIYRSTPSTQPVWRGQTQPGYGYSPQPQTGTLHQRHAANQPAGQAQTRAQVQAWARAQNGIARQNGVTGQNGTGQNADQRQTQAHAANDQTRNRPLSRQEALDQALRQQRQLQQQSQLPVYIPNAATERYFRQLFGPNRTTFRQSQFGYTRQGLSQANQTQFGFSRHGQSTYGQSYSNPGYQGQSTFNQSMPNYSLHNIQQAPGGLRWRY